MSEEAKTTADIVSELKRAVDRNPLQQAMENTDKHEGARLMRYDADHPKPDNSAASIGLPKGVVYNTQQDTITMSHDAYLELVREPLPSPTPGRKDDDNKPRYDLISPIAQHEMVAVLTYGAAKYTDRNWEGGIRYGRLFAAAMRHLWAWWGGERYDTETGFHHLAHCMCCVMFLLHYESVAETKYMKFDDRPTSLKQSTSSTTDQSPASTQDH